LNNLEVYQSLMRVIEMIKKSKTKKIKKKSNRKKVKKKPEECEHLSKHFLF